MRVALVPLDDRPCHTRFPRRLASLAGVELLMPPRRLLGRFLQPGDADGVLDWLVGVADECDACAVCTEMAVHGGLVASRTPRASDEDIRLRLGHLRRALRRVRGPRALGSVLMRATVTVGSPEDVQLYQDMALYSELQGRVDAGDTAAARALETVVARIPPAFLETFRRVRVRNHTVNRAAVEMVAGTVADFVALTQEDCRPHGLHRSEQARLSEVIADLGVQDQALLYPGADELSVVLLARVILSAEGQAPRIAVQYAPADGAERIAPFEDRPVRETAEGQVRATGAALGGTGDPLLLVAPPLAEPADLTGDDFASAPPVDDAGLGATVEALRAAKAPVALADTCVANGAYLPLVRRMRAEGLLRTPAVYAAWNTAGNSIGTAAAFLAVASASASFDSADLERFRQERFLDDIAYQGVARQRLAGLCAEWGADPVDLGAHAMRAEEWLSSELPRIAEEEGLAEPGTRCRVSLPWGRLFECDIGLV